jgi:hypothetical protein
LPILKRHYLLANHKPIGESEQKSKKGASMEWMVEMVGRRERVRCEGGGRARVRCEGGGKEFEYAEDWDRQQEGKQ